MKIVVNARPLFKPFTGMGQYTKYIFFELSKKFPNNEYLLLVNEDLAESYKDFFPKNVEILYVAEKNIGSAGMKKTWWEQVSVPEIMLKNKADIAYFTYPANPWDKSFYKKLKTSVTVHDAITWRDKEYSNRLVSKIYHSKTRKSLKYADLIMTVSKNSKCDIAKYSDISEDRIKVVYNDAGYEYKVKKSPGFIEKVLKKYNLKRQKYFIYCGGFDLRKNVQTLIKEYKSYLKMAKENGLDPCKLVIVGSKIFDSELYNSFNNLNSENIVKTGFLDDVELSALYQASMAFVTATKDEGFNIPMIEAANSETALIVSDIPVHLEVSNKLAIYADFMVKKDFAKKMLMIMNSAEREIAVLNAGKIANNFLWERSALRVNCLLEELLNDN